MSQVGAHKVRRFDFEKKYNYFLIFNLLRFIGIDIVQTNLKHVRFFAYNLRMKIATVFILAWLSAQSQYL